MDVRFESTDVNDRCGVIVYTVPDDCPADMPEGDAELAATAVRWEGID